MLSLPERLLLEPMIRPRNSSASWSSFHCRNCRCSQRTSSLSRNYDLEVDKLHRKIDIEFFIQ